MKDFLKKYYHYFYARAGNWDGHVGDWPAGIATEGSPRDRLSAIRAALAWVKRSQDTGADRGSAAWYSVTKRAWAASYPETTGYLIVSLLEALDSLQLDQHEQEEIEQRAGWMADWLVSVQLPGGAYRGGTADSQSPAILFNTAQALSGLLALGLRTGRESYLQAAESAADWMVDIQEPDGRWERFIHDRSCRTYYARAIWPLAAASQIDRFDKRMHYRRSAEKFAEWVLAQQQPNGWIPRCSFYTSGMNQEYNFLHTIAYAIEGLLEIGACLQQERFVQAALKAAEQFRDIFERSGIVYAEYDEQFRALRKYVCVVGCAQLGRVWGRCYEISHDRRFLDALIGMNRALRAVQPRDPAPLEIRGGFPASIPIFERYQPNQWTNWGTKFVIDSFLIEWRLTDGDSEGTAVTADLCSSVNPALSC